MKILSLLFALFVVLYASSRADVKKVRQVVESVRFATHFADAPSCRAT